MKDRLRVSPDTPVEMDLGDSGPLLVFGGPYSNLQATEALFGEARRLGVPFDRIVCTGDIVAYCGDPLATVQAIRDAGIAVVQGNCEEQLGNGAEDCGCGFAPGMMCHALSREWFTFATGELDRDSRAWMRNLPRRIWLRFAGRRLTAIHGGAARINRFIFKSTPWRIKRAEISDLDTEGVVAGHCGIPFTHIHADRMWHNAGVIGMPANDGHSGTWYSLLTAQPGRIQIEHRRLEYPHRAAAERMRKVGLSPHYAEALISGLWSSVDILPQTERRRTGKPLAASTSEWAVSPLERRGTLNRGLAMSRVAMEERR
jgi:hypothetical protein